MSKLAQLELLALREALQNVMVENDKLHRRIDALESEREALRVALQAMLDGEPRAADLAVRALQWGKL